MDILVVDDEPAVATYISDILEDNGYSVEQAANGQEALNRLKREDLPCLILLDVLMPLMDGWRFRDQLIQDPLLSKIPIVIVSVSHQAQSRAVQLGIEFLLKPFAEPDLLAKARLYCGSRP